MEWDQVSGGRSQQVFETQQSYETEWDMVNAVSFKKRPCSNTEGEFPALVVGGGISVLSRVSPSVRLWEPPPRKESLGIELQHH